jgi:hypothetical protein
MTIRSALVLMTLAGLTACEPPEGPNTSKPQPGAQPVPAQPAAQAPAKEAPAAQAPATGAGREISDSAKAAMKDHLVTETTKKQAWILSQPGNPEVAALVTSMTDVFKGAGWDVKSETVTGISLKPGLMTLVGDEQYPPYVDTVLKALDASGLDPKSASGYRRVLRIEEAGEPQLAGRPPARGSGLRDRGRPEASRLGQYKRPVSRHISSCAVTLKTTGTGSPSVQFLSR